jgi:ketosteroid isomerase-like protein
MDIKDFVDKWIAMSNAYDIENYLETYHSDAVLDDPTAGEVFKGHSGIRAYFEEYFIGYQTKTFLTRIRTISENEVHLDLEFTGTFSSSRLKGTFDLVFKDGKILSAKAELV